MVKTYRLCLYPACKWDVHIAAITKLRRKTHSPCVRRTGVVMVNVPMMSISEETTADNVTCREVGGELYVNGAELGPGQQFQIKTLKRELPPLPNRNYLSVTET